MSREGPVTFVPDYLFKDDYEENSLVKQCLPHKWRTGLCTVYYDDHTVSLHGRASLLVSIMEDLGFLSSGFLGGHKPVTCVASIWASPG